MGRAGVEERRRRGAEAALLVDGVEVDRPRLAVVALGQADAHRDPHPEQLRRLDPARPRAGLVDQQVAVIQRLQAEEVEVQIGGGIERRRQPLEVELEQARVDALDPHAVLQAGAQRPRVRALERPDAVAHDVPAERLLVEIREQDPPGEAREVAVALDQRLGVEHHQPLQVGARDPGADRAAQLALQRRRIGLQVQPDRRERDPLAQVGAGPRRFAPVGLEHRDRRRRRDLLAVLGAQQRALGAVDDVALGDPHVPAEDELLLDDVLDGLDRDVGAAERVRPLAHALGQRHGGLGVQREREERLADRDLDLRRAPRRHLARAADQPQRRTGRRGRRQRAAQDERLGHLDVAGGDQRRLDQRREVADGDAARAGEAGVHAVHRGADDRPGRGGVGLGLAAGQRERGQRVGDRRAGVHGGQRRLAAVGVDHGHRG